MTTKNIFIANMALSDMVLCLFTIPLTVLDLIHTFWPILVSTSITCQLLGSSQSVSLFFSSYAILLIAIDRLLHIVYPHKPQINSTQVKHIDQPSSLDLNDKTISVSLGLHPIFVVFCFCFCFFHTSFPLHKTWNVWRRIRILLRGWVHIYKQFSDVAYIIFHNFLGLAKSWVESYLCEHHLVAAIPTSIHHRLGGLHQVKYV